MSSAISIAVFYGMIRYRIITISFVDNSLETEVLKSVSDVAPTNNPQSITSNKFCGTINLNIQNGTTISNGAPIVNSPELESDWVYFEKERHVFSFSFNNVNENVFNFTDVIPKDKKVKYIKMVIYNLAGFSPKNN